MPEENKKYVVSVFTENGNVFLAKHSGEDRYYLQKEIDSETVKSSNFEYLSQFAEWIQQKEDFGLEHDPIIETDVVSSYVIACNIS